MPIVNFNDPSFCRRQAPAALAEASPPRSNSGQKTVDLSAHDVLSKLFAIYVTPSSKTASDHRRRRTRQGYCLAGGLEPLAKQRNFVCVVVSWPTNCLRLGVWSPYYKEHYNHNRTTRSCEQTTRLLPNTRTLCLLWVFNSCLQETGCAVSKD